MSRHNLPMAMDIKLELPTAAIKWIDIKITLPRNDVTYAELKDAVELGHSLQWVQDNLRPAGVAHHIVEDLYYKAKQELWEEQEVIKTRIGQLLYV